MIFNETLNRNVRSKMVEYENYVSPTISFLFTVYSYYAAVLGTYV